MYNSFEQQFQLQTAISRKRSDEFYIRWCQNSSLVEGFHLLFHESGVAPLFHPLSEQKKTLFRGVPGGALWSEYAPGTTFHVGEEKNYLATHSLAGSVNFVISFVEIFALIFTQTA